MPKFGGAAAGGLDERGCERMSGEPPVRDIVCLGCKAVIIGRVVWLAEYSEEWVEISRYAVHPQCSDGWPLHEIDQPDEKASA
jgi:hypothetical protein